MPQWCVFDNVQVSRTLLGEQGKGFESWTKISRMSPNAQLALQSFWALLHKPCEVTVNTCTDVSSSAFVWAHSRVFSIRLRTLFSEN